MSPEELGRLLDRHASALALFAKEWTTEPNDCVQEAFSELARQTSKPDDPVAWLYRVVKNRALNSARASQRRKRRENEHETDRQNWFQEHAQTKRDGRVEIQRFDERLEAPLDGELVTNALQQLPDQQREVIVARLWGSLTFQQIADLTESSASSVHRRWLAGLSQLRERLNPSCPETNENTKNPNTKIPDTKSVTRPTTSHD